MAQLSYTARAKTVDSKMVQRHPVSRAAFEQDLPRGEGARYGVDKDTSMVCLKEDGSGDAGGPAVAAGGAEGA